MKKTFWIVTSLGLAIASAAFFFLPPTATWESYFETEEDEREERARRQMSIKGAMEIERMIRTGPDGQISYQPGYQWVEYQKSQQSVANFRLENLEWRERGPGNFAGRARAIAVDASDPNGRTWLIGTASGGIWRTTDAGSAWSNTTVNAPNLAISTIAQAASNPRTFYAGTGEGAFTGGISGINGGGMLKSTDGGNTWQVLASTVPGPNNRNFLNVNRIIVDPANENVVIAATSNGSFQTFISGIMRSEDGGTTWQRVFDTGAGWVHQVVAAPTNFNRQYAAVNFGGVARSDDGGRTWRFSSLALISDATAGDNRTTGRTELAVSPTNPNRVFASVQQESATGTNDGASLFLSEDGATTWRQVADFQNTTISTTDFLGGQGSYNNCIAINPFNENVVYWGGVLLYQAEIAPAERRETEVRYLGVDDSETRQTFTFTSVTGWSDWNGRMQISNRDQTFPVEVRFGRGRRQRAHRFTTRRPNSGAGVPVADYVYRDYVDVPFEVWDTQRNRQVMISFRDQEDNRVFNLNQRENNDTELLTNREYLYIHNVAYDANNPDSRLARDGGQEQQLVYSLWPYMSPGQTWQPDNFNFTWRVVFDRLRTQGATIGNLTTIQQIQQIHVDHHQLTTVVLDRGSRRFRLISVNDGGLGYSDDNGASWTMRDRGLNTNQFYTAIKRRGANEYLGGVQDGNPMRSGPNPDANGLYTDQNTPNNFADGFGVAWHAANPQWLLGSNQYNRIYRSTNGGTSYQVSISGLTEACGNLSNCNGADTLAPFFTKIANSDRLPDLVFAVSRNGVWRSTNFAQNWTQIRLQANQGWGGFLDVEISDANPDFVWAGGSMITSTTPANNRFLFVSNNGGTSFNRVNNFTGRNLGNITAIVPDLFNPNTCYVTFSQGGAPKVLRTNDLGQTWQDLSGFGTAGTVSTNGFPDVATYSLLAFPDRRTIWAGTEIGLYESTDNGASWRPANNGLPNVQIWDMKVRDGQVVVATHGRGIWSVDLADRFANTPLANEDLPLAGVFKLYPNPAQARINLELPKLGGSTVEITLMSTLGQRIHAAKFPASQKLSLDLAPLNLPTGTYLVRAESGSEKYLQRLVIQ
ncbi:MAG: T9SS type A sorting domain-containing protein [Bernardetiaceae bacterium]|nr:T9SS type A sorting domain-containing protein [Bernardetiaceae bacterium]